MQIVWYDTTMNTVWKMARRDAVPEFNMEVAAVEQFGCSGVAKMAPASVIRIDQAHSFARARGCPTAMLADLATDMDVALMIDDCGQFESPEHRVIDLSVIVANLVQMHTVLEALDWYNIAVAFTISGMVCDYSGMRRATVRSENIEREAVKSIFTALGHVLGQPTMSVADIIVQCPPEHRKALAALAQKL